MAGKGFSKPTRPTSLSDVLEEEPEACAGDDILHARRSMYRITLAWHRWQASRGDRGRLLSSGRHYGPDPGGKPDENLSRGQAPCRPVGGCDRSRASYVPRHSGAG